MKKTTAVSRSSGSMQRLAATSPPPMGVAPARDAPAQRRVLAPLGGAVILLFFLAAPLGSRSPWPLRTPIVLGGGQQDGPGEGAQLVNVQIVFRHGARTPLTEKEYAGAFNWTCLEKYDGPSLVIRDAAGGAAPPPLADAVMPPLRGGCPQGTLTQTGYRMAADLGAALRRRYVSELRLLPPRYEGGGLLYAHSTNYRRTRATLQGVLSGLYPGPGAPSSFDVAATREAAAFSYYSKGSCPPLQQVVTELARKADERELAAPQADADRARAALGLPAAQLPPPLDWSDVRDVLAAVAAERPAARPARLDAGTEALIMRKAIEADSASVAPSPGNCLATEAACADVLRLSIGPLLWRVLHNMGRAAGAATSAAGAGGAGPRMFLFSAHDSTLHALLSALGHPPRTWAPFASHLAFELWRGAGGRAWARVLFSGEPLPMRGPRRRLQGGGGGAEGGGEGGAAWVEVSELQRRLKHVTASDEEKAAACWPGGLPAAR
ncbi:MAG: histidine phosphatase superfamily [Monoraphidium minutum]|nr:MAG: histidine phosphatase superfamily [Monoraphidium minutum]